MERKYTYDRYTVEVPLYLGTAGERAQVAIDEARERARLYVIPCEWRVHPGPGEKLVVVRKRNRRGR